MYKKKKDQKETKLYWWYTRKNWPSTQSFARQQIKCPYDKSPEHSIKKLKITKKKQPPTTIENVLNNEVIQ